MYCRHCGKNIYDGSKFCQFCGGNQGPDAPTKAAAPSSSASYSDLSDLDALFSTEVEKQSRQKADEAAMFEIRNGVLVKFHMPAEPVADITIPPEVTVIGEKAFERVSGLENVYVAGNLRRIEKEAFSVSRIKYFQMPSTVTYIGPSAFHMTNIESICIPYGVTRIEDHAFSYCTHLETVVMPNSITYIGNFAFNYCTALTYIDIPSGVTYIGENAFRECKKLEYLMLPERLCEIGVCAFYETGIRTLVIHDKVTKIPGYLCWGCKQLLLVEIGNGVKTIGGYAFADCPELMSVRVGSSLEEIETRAFECFDSTVYSFSLELPASLNSLGSHILQGRPLARLSITYGGSEAKWKRILGDNFICPPALIICNGI